MSNPDQKTVGMKFDQGKARPGLLPPSALLAVARVLEFGSRKYADNNWKHVAGAKTRYMDAAMRHLLQYLSGELEDKETGESHLAHAMCCLLFLLDAEETGWEFPPKESK